MAELIAIAGLGAALAFGAAIQPGPLQAFLLARAVTAGRRRTLPACISPLLSDGPIAVLAILLVGRLPPPAQQLLLLGGGALLLYLAWGAYGQARNGVSATSGVGTPATVFQAAAVNLLNPNPYLAWALVLGPTVAEAWRRQPALAVTFLSAFYATMVVTLAAFVLVAGQARALDPRWQRRLVATSALLLAGLGVYLLVAGAARLFTA